MFPESNRSRLHPPNAKQNFYSLPCVKIFYFAMIIIAHVTNSGIIVYFNSGKRVSLRRTRVETPIAIGLVNLNAV